MSPLEHQLKMLIADAVSDRDLVQRFVEADDEAAFERLLRRHGPMVQRLCWRMLGNAADVDDVFQATFLVLARRADTLRSRDAVAGWL
jgi:DNA-directed RNA polymerase specialized sigma24 family protein